MNMYTVQYTKLLFDFLTLGTKPDERGARALDDHTKSNKIYKLCVPEKPFRIKGHPAMSLWHRQAKSHGPNR